MDSEEYCLLGGERFLGVDEENVGKGALLKSGACWSTTGVTDVSYSRVCTDPGQSSTSGEV